MESNYIKVHMRDSELRLLSPLFPEIAIIDLTFRQTCLTKCTSRRKNKALLLSFSHFLKFIFALLRLVLHVVAKFTSKPYYTFFRVLRSIVNVVRTYLVHLFTFQLCMIDGAALPRTKMSSC